MGNAVIGIAAAMLMLLNVLTGCASDAGANNNKKKETNDMNEIKTFFADDSSVKRLGRTYIDENNTLWCAFSGTGAEFDVTAEKLTFTLTGDSVATSGNPDNYVRVAVYVDGERTIDDMLDAAEKTYTVFDGKKAKHNVKILKLSETAMSCMGIKSISTDGELKPAAEKERYIEIIGDSITCGYGVDDEDKEHHFKTSTEDVTKSYSYRTVTGLDADYSMVSISGYGIISGYADNGVKKPEQTIPQYYETLGFSYGGFGDKKAQDVKWDFSKREPDLIIINLGTNDDSYCLDDEEKQQEFGENYIKFLKTVRKDNPNSKILCTLGIMGVRLFKTILPAVEEYSKETGDTNIDTMRFAVQLEKDGYVADWHPTVTTHIKATERLTEKLKSLMNW